MHTSEHINEIAAALAKAQGEIANPEKDKTNPHFGSKYATLAAGLETARPVLAKHGLSVVQITGVDGDAMFLTTRIMHTSGQFIEGIYPVCRIGQHQQMGSALTYARRYALFALVGIAPEDEDGNDAAEAVGGKTRKPTADDRRQEAAAKAQAAAAAEAETYTERALIAIGDIDSVDRLDVWWKSEKANRQLHFTSNDDPLFVRLKDAVKHRGQELSFPVSDAAE